MFLIYDEFIDSLDLPSAKSVVGIDMCNVLRNYLLGRQIPGSKGDDEDFDDASARQTTFLTSCLRCKSAPGYKTSVQNIRTIHYVYRSSYCPPRVRVTASRLLMYTRTPPWARSNGPGH